MLNTSIFKQSSEQSLFLCPGEDLVPEPARQGQAAAGSRVGEAEDGLPVAPPPRPLPSPRAAGLFRPRRASLGLAVGRAAPHGPPRAVAPAAPAAPPRLPAGGRQHTVSQPAHVLDGGWETVPVDWVRVSVSFSCNRVLISTCLGVRSDGCCGDDKGKGNRSLKSKMNLYIVSLK